MLFHYCQLIEEEEGKVYNHNLLCVWKGTEWKFNPGIAVIDVNNITSFLHGNLHAANKLEHKMLAAIHRIPLLSKLMF